MADKTIDSFQQITDLIQQTTLLTASDIQELLANFAAAIESDELGVIPIHYNAGMWSSWRNANLKVVKKLIRTTKEIPDATLLRLDWIAHKYDSAAVRNAVLELLADAANGSVDEVLPAVNFFELLISNVSCLPTGLPQVNSRTRSLVALWFPTEDPLRIALDPECRIT